MMRSALNPNHSRRSYGFIKGVRGSKQGEPAQAATLLVCLSCQGKAKVSSSNLETNSAQLPASVCHPIPCPFPELLLVFIPLVCPSGAINLLSAENLALGCLDLTLDVPHTQELGLQVCPTTSGYS